jgi:chromate transporter
MSGEPMAHPTFADALRFWIKLGFISFGGPSGQIAIMHAELVERRRWISNARFQHALNFCMLLPGPEATQLAIYVGWLLHKTAGGIAAGVFFIFPSAIILWLLSFIYVQFGRLPWVDAMFYGLKPAVVGIVASALIRIGSRALTNSVAWTIAAIAFVAIYRFEVPFPIIVAMAGLIGLLGGFFSPSKFFVLDEKQAQPAESVLDDRTSSPPHTTPSVSAALKVVSISLILWFGPLLLMGWRLGPDHAVVREGVFYSKTAMVTFGGAYAVLPYVSQQAVDTFHWLSAAQMLDGLGLAETTPGPLIMVLQFVGFLGGWNDPGTLHPMLSATLGSAITTWVTFVPCFLWIFLGGPYIERLRGNLKLTAALTAVTAAVVGVILNLAVWFGLQVLFPDRTSMDVFAAAVCAVSFLGLSRWSWNVIPLIFGSAICGVLYKSLTAI